MNAIKATIAVLIIIGCSISHAANLDPYQGAFDDIYTAYKIAYSELNKAVERCSLHKKTDIDFKRIAKQLPKDLKKSQLNAALYLMKKRHSDTCIHQALGNYELKANDLRAVLAQAKKNNLRISGDKKIDDIQKLLDSRSETIFYHPESYFEMLADYQSINKEDRSKIESIRELQSNYDLVRLLNALGK